MKVGIFLDFLILSEEDDKFLPILIGSFYLVNYIFFNSLVDRMIKFKK